MKKVLNLLMAFSIVFFYSCDPKNADFDVDDQLTGTSDIGGVIVGININSDGKLLGAPSSSDLETATVAFSNTLLDLEIIKRTGGQDVAGYELTKSINGGTEVIVATSADLPTSLVI